MATRNLPFRQPLGARSHHVVHRKLLQHRSPHQPGIERQVEHGQRQRRQHQVVRNVAPARKTLVEGGHLLHAAGGEPAELDRKHDDQHQTRPEHRCGVGQHGQHGDHVVLPAVEISGGQAAQQSTRKHRQRKDREHQQQRRTQTRQDQLGDRHVMPERIAQVKADDLLHVEQQLKAKGLVKPEFLAQLGHEFGCRGSGLARQHVSGIAWRQLQQQKVQGDDHQNRRHRLKQASQGVTKAFRQRHESIRRWLIWQSRLDRTTNTGRGDSAGNC